MKLHDRFFAILNRYIPKHIAKVKSIWRVTGFLEHQHHVFPLSSSSFSLVFSQNSEIWLLCIFDFFEFVASSISVDPIHYNIWKNYTNKTQNNIIIVIILVNLSLNRWWCHFFTAGTNKNRRQPNCENEFLLVNNNEMVLSMLSQHFIRFVL